jgi:hypothetical protein
MNSPLEIWRKTTLLSKSGGNSLVGIGRGLRLLLTVILLACLSSLIVSGSPTR